MSQARHTVRSHNKPAMPNQVNLSSVVRAHGYLYLLTWLRPQEVLVPGLGLLSPFVKSQKGLDMSQARCALAQPSVLLLGPVRVLKLYLHKYDRNALYDLFGVHLSTRFLTWIWVSFSEYVAWRLGCLSSFLSRGLHTECARDRALGPLLSPGYWWEYENLSRTRAVSDEITVSVVMEVLVHCLRDSLVARNPGRASW